MGSHKKGRGQTKYSQRNQTPRVAEKRNIDRQIVRSLQYAQSDLHDYGIWRCQFSANYCKSSQQKVGSHIHSLLLAAGNLQWFLVRIARILYSQLYP